MFGSETLTASAWLVALAVKSQGLLLLVACAIAVLVRCPCEPCPVECHTDDTIAMSQGNEPPGEAETDVRTAALGQAHLAIGIATCAAAQS